MRLSVVALTTSIGLAVGSAIPTSKQLPIVNLGYVRQQAIAYNSTGTYYNFTNIAFAEPPLGSLRFSAPQPPKSISGVQNGLRNYPNQCPQAEPQWLTTATTPRKYHVKSSPPGSGETEDCLYLDVFAPKSVFDQAGNGTGAPVLVWIYGGGYVIGSKAGFNPATLVTVGDHDTQSEGVIFVAMNYRLGAFGFLGGDDFTSQGGTLNNGLLDQRLALEWVQKYISKFGGDPNRVTVMGESGGATSIIRQLTALDSEGQPLDVPFERAILQSAAELSLTNNSQNDALYHQFLKGAGASNLEEARKIDSKKLKTANFDLVLPAETGNFLFGAVYDGTFVRGQASNTLVAEGPNKNISVMTAHNSDEGTIFIPPRKDIESPSFNFTTLVENTLGGASPEEVNYVAQTLYPPPSSKTPYANEYERVDLFTSEVAVNCNAYGIQLAFNRTGYAYEFAVSPGVHVQDVYSTFYNGPNGNAPPINVTVATEMQKFFMNYAASGNPNNANLAPNMPIYGSQGKLLKFSDTQIKVAKDGAANARCNFLIHRNTSAHV